MAASRGLASGPLSLSFNQDSRCLSNRGVLVQSLGWQRDAQRPGLASRHRSRRLRRRLRRSLAPALSLSLLPQKLSHAHRRPPPSTCAPLQLLLPGRLPGRAHLEPVHARLRARPAAGGHQARQLALPLGSAFGIELPIELSTSRRSLPPCPPSPVQPGPHALLHQPRRLRGGGRAASSQPPQADAAQYQ